MLGRIPLAVAILVALAPAVAGADPAVPAAGMSPRSGPTTAGALVAIQGDGVGAATEVDFDTSASTDIVRKSDRRILVAVPAHGLAGVEVSVQTPSGAIAAGRYTYAPRLQRAVAPPELIDPSGGVATSLSCPSAGLCFQIDNGASVRTLRDGVRGPLTGLIRAGEGDALSGISCPDTGWCLVVASGGRTWRYSGGSWTEVARLPSTGRVGEVSCASRAFCVAVDGSAGWYRYNGSSWTSQAPGELHSVLRAVSCVRGTGAPFCAAVGPTVAVTYRTGSFEVSPLPFAGWSAVSCVAPARCLALNDYDEYAARYDGSAWTADALSIGGQVLSCASAHFCVAGGSDDFDARQVEVDPTTLAMRVPTLRVDVGAVSCASTSFCVVTDPAGAAIRYDGTGWSRLPDGPASGGLQDISCPSTTFCRAVDASGNVVHYADGGWHPSHLIGADQDLTSISCPTMAFCVAVGDQQAFVYSHSHWRHVPAADQRGPTERVQVSCSSPTFCVILAPDGNPIEWDGRTWTRKPNILRPGGGEVFDVSCSDRNTCYAVGVRYLDEIDGIVVRRAVDGRWQPPTVQSPNHLIEHVSCTSIVFCAVEDASGYLRLYTGTTWGPLVPAAADPGGLGRALACASARFCLTQRAGSLTVFDGNAVRAVDDDGSLRYSPALACPAVDSCWVTDTDAAWRVAP